MADITIKRDTLSDNNIVELLQLHLKEMKKHSPPGHVHALKKEELLNPEISFWSAWVDSEFAGCGALKELGDRHGEIKSMKTKDAFLRLGVAQSILGVIVDEARTREYAKLSLETGTMQVFQPAIKLYKSAGFIECEPFGNYTKNPYSLCLSLEL